MDLALALIFDVVLIGVCSYAFWWGGAPEKIGAGINLGGALVSSAMRLIELTSWNASQILVPAIDVLVLTGFFVMATRTNRFWPIWCFGFALGDVATSMAGLIFHPASLFAYASSEVAYTYFALGALAIGTYAEARRPEADSLKGFRR